MLTYLNFELHIIDLQNGQYIARVVDSPAQPAGEPPSVTFTMPFDPPTLQRINFILSGERRPRQSTPEAVARQFGESMFQAVFRDGVYTLYKASVQEAEAQNKGLRIRLNLNRAGALAMIAWEFLRDPEVDYLVLSRTTPLVHYTQRFINLSRMEAVLPLRILVMISAPEGLPPINEKLERANLEKAVEKLKQRGLVEIDYVEEASIRELQRKLRESEYHVFHYIGHSRFDPVTGVGTLALEDPIRHRELDEVRGEALARELYEEAGIRMVVLNSCQGAQANVIDPFSGIASSLVQRGIPAVVAQQFEISDAAAICFSEEFYRSIAEGLPVEAAVAEGRRAIASTARNVEWATPVLFLHSDDSRHIFNFGKQTFTQRYRTPLIAAGITALIVGVLIGFAAFIGWQAETRDVFAAPPTATPIPNVDLVVTDVRLSPRNPQPGSLVAVFIDIENRGTDPAPPFTYEWQADLLNPQTTTTREVQGLAAGGVLHDSLTYRYGWWGTFISETRLDILNQIIEISEQNNRPIPVRTNNQLPLVIDLNEPLPDGTFVQQSRPVEPGTFAAWGLTLSAEKPTDPACAGIVPWFKFIGISRIALGTGLPDNPNACADGTLVITFPIRDDGNPGGVRAVQAVFAPGSGNQTVNIFRDANRTELLGTYTAPNDRRAGVTISTPTDVVRLARIYTITLQSAGSPLLVTTLSFTAP